MQVGTKSVLFGAHCFFIHPFFVALAWWQLYGFPFDPRLWLCFFVHDLGYWGKANMDGPEGESHVELGAKVMRLFGQEWADFCMFHSRFYAKKHSKPYSRLCVADKLAMPLEPYWLYLPRVILSGEVFEYIIAATLGSRRGNAPKTTEDSEIASLSPLRAWHRRCSNHMRRFAYEHKDCKTDTWTPETTNAS